MDATVCYGNQNPIRSPFPWFGGKSRVGKQVWDCFGTVSNYVEPFFGSGAVLFGAPWPSDRIETVNDKDAFVSNFWRAVANNPEEVAFHADWPVIENDLHARHAWLVEQRQHLSERVEGNPDFFDAKIAGWWVWGICSWIGGGWCSGKGPWKRVEITHGDWQLVHLGDGGQGVNRQRVHLADGGQGVNRQRVGKDSNDLVEYFSLIRKRMKRVRVCCGDWSRVCGPSPTTHNGLTAVFLDPPYSGETGRDKDLYLEEDLSVAHKVRKWCLENGDNKLLRIALCGYEGEHNELECVGWRKYTWKAHGGYAAGKIGPGEENCHKERIWFSPHCLGDKQTRFDFYCNP